MTDLGTPHRTMRGTADITPESIIDLFLKGTSHFWWTWTISYFENMQIINYKKVLDYKKLVRDVKLDVANKERIMETYKLGRYPTYMHHTLLAMCPNSYQIASQSGGAPDQCDARLRMFSCLVTAEKVTAPNNKLVAVLKKYFKKNHPAPEPLGDSDPYEATDQDILLAAKDKLYYGINVAKLATRKPGQNQRWTLLEACTHLDPSKIEDLSNASVRSRIRAMRFHRIEDVGPLQELLWDYYVKSGAQLKDVLIDKNYPADFERLTLELKDMHADFLAQSDIDSRSNAVALAAREQHETAERRMSSIPDPVGRTPGEEFDDLEPYTGEVPMDEVDEMPPARPIGDISKECLDMDKEFYNNKDIQAVQDYNAAKSEYNKVSFLFQRALRKFNEFNVFVKRSHVLNTRNLVMDIIQNEKTGILSCTGEKRRAEREQMAFELYKLGFSGLLQRFSNPFANIAVFGKAGTGKTKIAEVMAQVLGRSGFLLYADTKEYTAKDLTGSYLGESGKKMFAALLEGLERVVFIDEAYSINSCIKDEYGDKKIDMQGSSYGLEAIAELLKFTDRYRGKQVIVVAGYEGDMEACFFGANEGLTRRFPTRYRLSDYDAPDLMDKFLADFTSTTETELNRNGKKRNQLRSTQDFSRFKRFVQSQFKLADDMKIFMYQMGDMLSLVDNFMADIESYAIRHRIAAGRASLLQNNEMYSVKRRGTLEAPVLHLIFQKTMDKFIKQRNQDAGYVQAYGTKEERDLYENETGVNFNYTDLTEYALFLKKKHKKQVGSEGGKRMTAREKTHDLISSAAHVLEGGKRMTAREKTHDLISSAAHVLEGGHPRNGSKKIRTFLKTLTRHKKNGVQAVRATARIRGHDLSNHRTRSRGPRSRAASDRAQGN